MLKMNRGAGSAAGRNARVIDMEELKQARERRASSARRPEDNAAGHETQFREQYEEWQSGQDDAPFWERDDPFGSDGYVPRRKAEKERRVRESDTGTQYVEYEPEPGVRAIPARGRARQEYEDERPGQGEARQDRRSGEPRQSRRPQVRCEDEPRQSRRPQVRYEDEPRQPRRSQIRYEDEPRQPRRPQVRCEDEPRQSRRPGRYEDEPRQGRRQEREARPVNRTGLYMMLLLLGLLALAVVIGLKVFEITAIEVKGNDTMTAESVVRLAGITRGENIFKVNLGQARKNLESDPLVEVLGISRIFPDKIRITIRQRKPHGAIAYLGAYVIIDERGFVLDERADLPAGQYPLVTGVDIKPSQKGKPLVGVDKDKLDAMNRLLSALYDGKAIGFISEANLSEADNIRLLTGEGLEIDLGKPTDLVKKAQWIACTVPELRSKGYTSGILYVTGAGNPVYSASPAAGGGEQEGAGGRDGGETSPNGGEGAGEGDADQANASGGAV